MSQIYVWDESNKIRRYWKGWLAHQGHHLPNDATATPDILLVDYDYLVENYDAEAELAEFRRLWPQARVVLISDKPWITQVSVQARLKADFCFHKPVDSASLGRILAYLGEKGRQRAVVTPRLNARPAPSAA